MEAQIEGTQRKVFGASVRPLRGGTGSGIPLQAGQTKPFRVARSWSAPAGLYSEAWYVVKPDSREVMFEGPVRDVRIWGLQGLTEIIDEVREAILLEPGRYSIVFALGGVRGGEMEVEVAEGSGEQAA